MIYKTYKQNKSDVLKIYNEYVGILNKTGKTIDSSVEKQADKITNEVFNLMVLGEAKSGKSTFINAYLGEEVVPMDVRQCTSAIITIHRDEDFTLTVETANGKRSTIYGKEQISKYLKEHATIPDKYRNIPTTTIDSELLIKYGKAGRKITSSAISEFANNELEGNIFNISDEEYQNLISDYVYAKATSWEDIPIRMDITYPLSEEMKGITIIDSPGIGAGGNVGWITENYINNANAIIFVKSLTGQALESSSFMNFMRTNCREKNKNSLFLLFTGKANLQGSEFESLKDQAFDMYKNDINPDHILFVDSKIQLFLNKCLKLGTEEKIDAFFDNLDTNNNDYAPATNCWLKSKGDISKFTEKMNVLSNFESINAALEKFAMIAGYLQLIEFLDNLEKECSRISSMSSSIFLSIKESIEDPAKIENSIHKKKNEIAETFNKMNEGIDAIVTKYIDPVLGEGIIKKKAAEKKDKYMGIINSFLNLRENEITNSTFDEMKIKSMAAVDDAQKFCKDICKQIIDECNEKLIQYTDDPTQISANAYMPNFTEADFDKIIEQARKKSSGYEEIEEGLTFKTIERIPFYHRKEHVRLVANSIKKRLDLEIIPNILTYINDFTTKCVDTYKGKLQAHKIELETEYNRILEHKDENEKLLNEVRQLQEIISLLSKESEAIESEKGELTNYVK